MGKNRECSELGEQGTNIIPWKSVQHWLGHCKNHLGDSSPSPFHLFAGKVTNGDKSAQTLRETRRKRRPAKQPWGRAQPNLHPLQVWGEGRAAAGKAGLWKRWEEKQLLPSLPAVTASPSSPSQASRDRNESCSLMSQTEGSCLRWELWPDLPLCRGQPTFICQSAPSKAQPGMLGWGAGRGGNRIN